MSFWDKAYTPIPQQSDLQSLQQSTPAYQDQVCYPEEEQVCYPEEEQVCYPEENTSQGVDTLTKGESPFAISQDKMIDTLRISAKKSSEKVTEKIAELTKAIPFAGDDSNGVIKAELNVGIVDKNGFLDNGEEDLNVNFNGKVSISKDSFVNSLNDKLAGKKIIKGGWYSYDVSIKNVSYSQSDNAYKIKLFVDIPGPINDDIDLVIKTDQHKNLVMSVEDKWIPDFIKSEKDILNKVQSKLKEELDKAGFSLDAKIKGEKLYFLPKIEEKTFELPGKGGDSAKEFLRIDRSNMGFHNVKFDIEKNGDLSVNFKNLLIVASNLAEDKDGNRIPEMSSGDIDFAQLDISANIGADSKTINIRNGKLATRLDDKEAHIIEIEGSTLANHFKETKVELYDLNATFNIDKNNKVTSKAGGDISVSLSRPDKSIGIDGNIATSFDSSGDFQIASKGLTITHPDGKSLVKELLIADDKDGFQFHIKEDEKDLPAIKSRVTNSYLDLLIRGDQYKERLFDRIDSAKESVNLEVFLYSGNIAKEVTDKLLFKSSGLQEKDGNLTLANKDGVKVKVIFDTSKGDKTEDTHESFQMVKEKYEKVISDIRNGVGKYSTLSQDDRETAISNIEDNMKWNILKGGISKIDHRKIVVIDGKSAFTGGGINFTDSAFSKHDVMMDLWGPAVSDVQKEFIQNWEEVAGTVDDSEKKLLIKDDKTLTREMKNHQRKVGDMGTSKTQVLVTDDNQFDVYQKMIEEIKKAKSEINIEHAYFTDEKVKQEVAGALRRGVKVNLVIPEQSDEGDKIHYGNLGTLQFLKQVSQEPGAGEFNGYLYKWEKTDTYETGKFNHTKAMSFDGKTAIVGSTNLTSRSLHGTMTGFLFNREMSLFIDDKKEVGDLNNRLFLNDMKPEYSKKLDDQWFRDLAKEQKKIDKYTAIQPLF